MSHSAIPSSQAPPKYPPSIAAALMAMVVATMFALQNGWLLLLQTLADFTPYHAISDNTLLVMSVVLTAVCLVWLIVFWQYFRIRKDSVSTAQARKLWQSYLALLPMDGRVFWRCLWVFLLIVFIASLLANLATTALSPTPSADAAQMMGHDTPMWLFALMVMVCAPIYEELICRGLFWRLGEDIFSHFTDNTNHITILTSLISSGVFSLLHFQYNLIDTGVMFAVALGLCYARVRTGSVFAPMLLHSINNSLVLLLLILD
ncbi:CPBP family intramembrane metalloprotease [Moraxella sp. FZLJ2107]|uniref:CPBP family intramembrane glutamic endopeptidase n=1 Tax=unclassified Moraxella TaxID=2685852 RepID=UPI0020C91872|nr:MULTISPECIES: CPBP family intramembrane glutamic endopeptidase [unclassified Moraxella]UTO05298.1 CPBP family intramembrane metalloprotease [Moraxella sp. FZLJ2107]UTO22033.1 CPBP family intramembrane metalloprotease [Moraxella sp. FZLJ2109]